MSACIARSTGEFPSTLTVMPEKLVRHTLASPCSSGTISASDSWMPLTSVKAGFAPIKTGKEHRTIGESCMLAITLWFGRIRTALTNLTVTRPVDFYAPLPEGGTCSLLAPLVIGPSTPN